MDVIKIVK